MALGGQNGARWTDVDVRPLSALTLQAARRQDDLPLMRTADGACDDETTTWWFEHFATVCSTGLSYMTGSYVPLFQGSDVLESPLLTRDARQAEPDLSQLSTGVVAADGPAVVLSPAHPYALGEVAPLSRTPILRRRWSSERSPYAGSKVT